MSIWDLFKSKKNREGTGIFKDGREISHDEKMTDIRDAMTKVFAARTGASENEVRQRVESAINQVEHEHPKLFKRGRTGRGRVAQNNNPDEDNLKKLFGESLKKYSDHQLAHLVLNACKSLIDQADNNELASHIEQMASDISYVFRGEGEMGYREYCIFRRFEINFARAQIEHAKSASVPLDIYASLFIDLAMSQGLSGEFRYKAIQDQNGRRIYILPGPFSAPSRKIVVGGICIVVEGVRDLLRVRFAERFEEIEFDITIE